MSSTVADASLAVSVHDLNVRYGRKVAVRSLSFSVPRGSVLAILGRNGAGKSSLIRCLLGEQLPTSGTVDLLGRDVWKHRASLMQHVGVVAEEADAPPQMRVAEIEKFHARLYDRWDTAAVAARLRRFGISAATRFGDLSKGQKKQVALALALASSPELLVLDDPTLGLDVAARKSLYDEVISELADRGITVVLTTHDLAGIETLADHVVILKGGALVLDEEMETLKGRFRRLRFATPSPLLEESSLKTASVRRWGSGAEAVVSNFDEVAFARLRSSGPGDAEVTPMSLEDIFLAVTGDDEGVQA